MLKHNDKFLIETPEGWKDFEGIARNSTKLGRRLSFNDGGYIDATYEHPFINNKKKKTLCSDLKIGNKLFSKGKSKTITDITENILLEAYDIIHVDSKDHTYYANDVANSNCDELAFVNRRIALEFWSSIFPTLSCLVGSTYVLNPLDGYRRIDTYIDNPIVGDYHVVLNEHTWTMGGVSKISHLYISPPSETLVIRTESGYRVEITPDHPLQTKSEMIKGNSLKVGDSLMYSLGMNCYGQENINPYKLNDKEYISSLITSDACLQLTQNDTGILVEVLFKDFTENNYTSKDYDVVYRLKLILANQGYHSRLWSYGEDWNIDVNWLYKQGNFFENITKIEKSYQELTYDFTVPEVHNFLQNGLIGSNTGGSCIITSTPTDDESLFAQLWKDAERTYDEHGNELEGGVGVNGFSAYKATWDRHPDRDENFKKQQIQMYGEEFWLREHELQFLSEHETLLGALTLKGLTSKQPILTNDNKIRWFKTPELGRIYLVALDPSMGTGGDNAAIQVFEFPTMIQVAEWFHNRSDPSVQIRILISILNGFKSNGFDEDDIFWTFENNGCGDTINMYLREVEDEHEIFGNLIKEKRVKGQGKTPRKGLLTTNSNKRIAFSKMKLWIEQGNMTINSKPLIREFKTFVRSGATYKALSGTKDDLVLATMLITRMALEVIKDFEDDEGHKLGVVHTMGFDEDGDDDYSYFPLPVG